MKNKEDLDTLVATLTIKLGKKISQQDVLSACVKLSLKNIDELVQYFAEQPKLTKKRVKEILKMADDFEFDTTKSIDEEIYRS
ncbi:MAG: hypothetical protein ACTSYB_04325 [Candidatus Helarchaeota archaeon]